MASGHLHDLFQLMAIFNFIVNWKSVRNIKILRCLRTKRKLKDILRQQNITTGVSKVEVEPGRRICSCLHQIFCVRMQNKDVGQQLLKGDS